MDVITVLYSAMQQLINQLIAFVPKLIIAWIIWWLGNKLLDLGVNMIKRIDIPKTKIDDKIINLLVKTVMPVGKVILVLIILDYLGIGTSIISAVATGLTLTIAIALGLAFGKALEPEATNIVKLVKKHFNIK